MKTHLTAAVLATGLALAPIHAAKAEPITATAIVILGSKIVAWWAGKTVIIAKTATVAKAAVPAAAKGGLIEGGKGAFIGTGRSMAIGAGEVQAKQIIKNQVIRRSGKGAIDHGGRAAIQAYRQLDN